MPDITTTWMDGHELKTEYDIEYIADPVRWKIICSDRHPAPWELYDHIILEDFSDAMERFCVFSCREDVFDVRMLESTYIDGKLVRERSPILSSSFRYSIGHAVNSGMQKRIDELVARHSEDSRCISDAMAFLEKFNAVKQFGEFRRDRERGIS